MQRRIYQFHKCLNARFVYTTVLLVWCLKNVKDLILELSISGSFYSGKTKLLDYCTIILVSFRLGGSVVEVADSWAIYQGYWYQ